MRRIIPGAMVLLALLLTSCLFPHPPVLEETDYAFVGDGITARTDFNSAFAYTGGGIANLGRDGTGIEDTILAIGEIDTVRPGNVFVLIGVNDAMRDIGEFGRLYSDYLALLSLRTKENGGYIDNIYVETILPVLKDEETNLWIDSANETIRSVVTSFSAVTLLDVAPHFKGEDDGLGASYASGSAHLSEEGKALWISLLSSMAPVLY